MAKRPIRHGYDRDRVIFLQLSTWQKLQTIDIQCFAVQKNSVQIIQPVFENTKSFSFVFLHLYRPDFFVKIIADFVVYFRLEILFQNRTKFLTSTVMAGFHVITGMIAKHPLNY